MPPHASHALQARSLPRLAEIRLHAAACFVWRLGPSPSSAADQLAPSLLLLLTRVCTPVPAGTATNRPRARCTPPSTRASPSSRRRPSCWRRRHRRLKGGRTPSSRRTSRCTTRSRRGSAPVVPRRPATRHPATRRRAAPSRPPRRAPPRRAPRHARHARRRRRARVVPVVPLPVAALPPRLPCRSCRSSLSRCCCSAASAGRITRPPSPWLAATPRLTATI